MHYKTRVNVYMVLGRGVVGSCFGVHCCSYLGGGGFHALVNLLRLHSSSVLVRASVKLL